MLSSNEWNPPRVGKSPRERLIEVAAELFNRDGFHGNQQASPQPGIKRRNANSQVTLLAPNRFRSHRHIDTVLTDRPREDAIALACSLSLNTLRYGASLSKFWPVLLQRYNRLRILRAISTLSRLSGTTTASTTNILCASGTSHVTVPRGP